MGTTCTLPPRVCTLMGKYVTASFIGAVDASGHVLGHPPVHLHHIHVLHTLKDGLDAAGQAACTPAASIAQRHGDSQCADERGGAQCLGQAFPKGHGAKITDEIEVYAMINDGRNPLQDNPPMDVYIDISLRWTNGLPSKAIHRVGLASYGSPYTPNSAGMVVRLIYIYIYIYCPPTFPIFLPQSRLYGVVLLHVCVLPSKYRTILEMLLKLIGLCEIMGAGHGRALRTSAVLRACKHTIEFMVLVPGNGDRYVPANRPSSLWYAFPAMVTGGMPLAKMPCPAVQLLRCLVEVYHTHLCLCHTRL